MLSRRSVLKASLGPCSCWVCGSPAIVNTSLAAQADQAIHIQGLGYDLRFVGAQRETIMNGKLAAALDLRTLERTPHLYGIGPIEQLRGEVTIAASRPSLARVRPDGSIGVTESFEAGVPFLVWAQVPVWRALPIPPEVRSFADLEAFVPRSAASVGLDPHKPLPFLIRGRADLIEFHILNRIGDEAHNAERHKKIQAVFELEQAEAIIVGFHSAAHQGVFTPIGSAIHIHFQTADNSKSGHIQKLELGNNAVLELPHA